MRTSLAIAMICSAATLAAASSAQAGGFVGWGTGCGACATPVAYAPAVTYGAYAYGGCGSCGAVAVYAPTYEYGYVRPATVGYSYGYGGYDYGCGGCGAVYATPVYVVNQGQYYPYVSHTDVYNRSYYSGGPYANPLGHRYETDYYGPRVYHVERSAYRRSAPRFYREERPTHLPMLPAEK